MKEERTAYAPAEKKELVIHFTDFTQKPLLKEIKSVLMKTPGQVPVELHFEKEHKNLAQIKTCGVSVCDELINNLEAILGQNKVEVLK